MTVEHDSDAHGRPNPDSSARWAFDGAGSAGSFSTSHRAEDAHASSGQPPRAALDRQARSGGDDDSFGAGAAPVESPAGEGGDPGRKRRRRGSRGGRRRRKNRPDGPEGSSAAEGSEGGDGADEQAGPGELSGEAVEPAFAADDEAPPFKAPRSIPAARTPMPRAAPRADRPPEIDDAVFEADADSDSESAAPGGGGPEGALAEGPGEGKRRRRGRRGGRNRRGRNREGEGSAAPGAAGELAPAPRGGHDLWAEEQRLEAGVDTPLPGEEEDGLPPGRPARAPRSGAPGASGASGQAPQAGRKKRRRRGSRGGRARDGERGRGADRPAEIEAIPGELDDDLPLREIAVIDDGEGPPAGESGRRGERGRRRKDKRVEAVDDDEEVPAPEVLRDVQILVNAADPEEKRVAVVQNGHIADFQMTVRTETSVVNDIYRGRVVNLEPAIGAAFVDFGQGRNGFLHTSDVLSAYGEPDWSLDKLLTTSIDPDEWDSEAGQAGGGAEASEDGAKEEPKEAPAGKKRGRAPKDRNRRFRARPRLPITDLLKKGEMVVVQVTKDAIGDKGPTLTTYISIPGRYLVLMPSMSRTGVSRKIEDEKERRRLKKILGQLEIPPGMGVIVRTAGIGRSKADLKRDLDYLRGAWEAFARRLKHGHGPAPLYQESDISIRTVRDLFTPSTEAVIVDDPQVHEQIVEFTKQLMPEAVERVRLYTGPKPLFHSTGVEADFEKIFARRIELPSGGSVVFDQAEALVAIDVNSGRTRTEGFDFEEIALKTNLEAVPEIARQIRLRDLGGIIVVDFIDMMKVSNMKAVERAFKTALDTDRARSKIGRISQFGLLELTRQRLGPGISKKVFTPCHRCRGSGRIRTVESRAAAILRRLGSAMTLKGFTAVEVRAHPEVVRYLKDVASDHLRALEYRFEREIQLQDVPDQVEDSVLRYLRADGREVRPGGRRKR